MDADSVREKLSEAPKAGSFAKRKFWRREAGADFRWENLAPVLANRIKASIGMVGRLLVLLN
ncbi:MAG: hypothetical protein Q7R93_02280 [bacterium]|nr:hypothetical protein [bacterium]